MGTYSITNCGDCAYAQKENRKMWCPFHDLPVNNKLVCDDFLNEFDSPQWKSLSKGMSENTTVRKVPQYTSLDILAYIISGVLIIGVAILYVVAHPRKENGL